MTAPYLLISDLHAHAWSQYAAPMPNGMNSRLEILTNEVERAVGELKARGGNLIVVAGDVFHERGSINPEVFNPIYHLFQNITQGGFEVYAIPGNHDLKGKETNELGNAIQSLGALENFTVVTKPTIIKTVNYAFGLVPWISKLDELKKAIALLASANLRNKMDLIIHAGIDGVIKGLPDHGLTDSELANYGFKRVFAGHYHHHKDFGNGVISIGAMTHQTFSDIGAKAGFLLVEPSKFTYMASRAPSFVDINENTDEEEIALIAPDNYVRVRGFKFTDEENEAFRKELMDMGAVGVSMQVARESVSARPAGSAAKTISLEASVDSYIDTLGHPDPSAIKAEALDILTNVRVVA